MTLDERYTGGWRNVDDDCMLCEMVRRTEWHLETPNWVIAEKLGGGPFVVYKQHTEELSDEEWDRMEHIVGLVYDDFEIDVRMGLVEHHWHGHLVTADSSIDLTDE